MRTKEYLNTGENDVPIRFKRSNEEIIRKDFYPGMKLVMNKKTYHVLQTFPHFISCISEAGYRECFGYFEVLIEMEDRAEKVS